MAVNLDNPGPIDPNDPQLQKMLANLQGNILKGHGRDHTVHIFIKLDTADVEAARARLVAVAGRIVTSAWQQHLETEQLQKFGIPGALFGTLSLTAKAYRTLGLTKSL